MRGWGDSYGHEESIEFRLSPVAFAACDPGYKLRAVSADDTEPKSPAVHAGRRARQSLAW